MVIYILTMHNIKKYKPHYGAFLLVHEALELNRVGSSAILSVPLLVMGLA